MTPKSEAPTNSPLDLEAAASAATPIALYKEHIASMASECLRTLRQSSFPANDFLVGQMRKMLEAIVEKSRKDPDGSERFVEYYGQLIDRARRVESKAPEGRYISPSELDRIEDLLDKTKGVRPSLAEAIAMVMEIRDARGWKRLDGIEKSSPAGGNDLPGPCAECGHSWRDHQFGYMPCVVAGSACHCHRYKDQVPSPTQAKEPTP